MNYVSIMQENFGYYSEELMQVASDANNEKKKGKKHDISF